MTAKSVRAPYMSIKFRQYILDAYAGNREIMPEKIRKDFPIQIDDQDDFDSMTDFCNIFVTIKKNNCFEIELFGNIPHSKKISDLSEIYGGSCNEHGGRIVMNLSVQQIEALVDLAKMIRESVSSDQSLLQENRKRIMARTISSLYRFVRIVNEFSRLKTASL
jgi:hypothetical protein